MKTFTFFIALFLAVTVSAQTPQSFRYQAVARDNSGVVLVNQNVSFRISILSGSVNGSIVYSDNHSGITTNAFGLVELEIGKGTPETGTFSTINWGNNSYFVKVEMDPAGGAAYQVLSTSQLLSVPYALHASTAVTAKNVTGLEQISETEYGVTSTGWRLVGQNPANYGMIGSYAVDLSFSWEASTTRGATGYFSTAMGYGTTADGDYSTAMGNETKAEASYSTAIGRYNLGGGYRASWVATDPLFEIGNGTSSAAPNNALTVLKNGTITAPSLTNSLITTAGAKALITKEYADANLKSSGLEKITEGTNTGWRLIGQNPANYGNIGINAVDLSVSTSASATRGATGQYSTAMGNASTASGNTATSMGYRSIASGSTSTAIGYWSTASGSTSTAMGDETVASGNYATSMGSGSQASGNYTLATGYATKAEAYYSTAIGTYNIGGGSPTSWVATDPLFEIGNGTSTRNNALTVYKNGNTDVDGILRAQNNIWPGKGAGVEIAYNNSLGIGYVQAYDRNTAIWKDLAFGALNVRPVSDNFTSLGTSSTRWSKVYSANGSIQTSDSRMKKEINDIPYGLNCILKLRPVTFKWKEGNQNVNLGLIAQDVQNLIPEVVDIGNDKDKTLGLNYSNLIPVLIKAIQEHQELIQQLKTEVELLKK